MDAPLTAGDLDYYRRLRVRYLTFGKRVFKPDLWAIYCDLDERVRSAVGELAEPHRTVARLYYVSGLSCVAVGMRTYYSERHVRRLRDASRTEILRT